MQRGTKPTPPSVKEARGTLQPWRDGERVEIVVPSDPPLAPALTPSAQVVWETELPRVMAAGVVELDSGLFGVYCHLKAAVDQCFASDETPPMSSITELRRLSELLGIAGPKSRVGRAPPPKPDGNPFTKRR